MSAFSVVLFLVFFQGFLAHQPESLLPAAVKYAIARSFNGTPGADELNIAIQTDLKENQVYFLDTIDKILVDNWQFGLQVSANNEIGQLSSDYNLWLVDSHGALHRLLAWIRAYRRNSQLYFFIVLKTSDPEKDYKHELQLIFLDFLDLMVANVNVLIEDEHSDGGVLFYTFFPFRESTSCRSATTFLTHRFDKNRSSLRSEGDFFPSKADNVHGCPLRLISPSYKASNLSDFVLKNDNFMPVYFEIFMLKKFASRLNFTIELYDSPVLEGNIEDFLVLQVSQKQSKPERKIKIDASLGYVSNFPYSTNFSSQSVPYYLSWFVIVLCPRPNTLQSFAWILKPFDFATWNLIMVSFVLIVGCTAFAKTCRRAPKIFHLQCFQLEGLEILSVVIGASVPHLPRRSFLRFCIMVVMFGTFVLRSAHQGKVFDAFRKGTMHSPPRSIRELFKENYTIYSHPHFKPIINDLNQDEYINLQEMGIDQTLEFSDFFENKGRNALVTSFVYIHSFYTAEQRRSLAVAPVFGMQICVFFQRHSVIQPKIDDIIFRLEEAGILHYYRKNFDNLQNSGKRLDEGEKEPQRLGLRSLAFVFYFGALFCAISCFIFVLELYWAKISTLSWKGLTGRSLSNVNGTRS